MKQRLYDRFYYCEHSLKIQQTISTKCKYASHFNNNNKHITKKCNKSFKKITTLEHKNTEFSILQFFLLINLLVLSIFKLINITSVILQKIK